MTTFTALINALAAAQARHAEATRQQVVTTSSYDHRGWMLQAYADERAAADELQRAKDALCRYVLANRERISERG